ncbi:MFS transporter [Rhodospirillaceae bacterium KN72]|uniref:MFS transporter n=1 Tax=Pacificispira spongiicola TaxID=2729598 RepID=A0A7Y0E1D8_9PROT|nr:MFS transporter [Pacificispira spongiicola]NMM45363.1 MFS transporter [Pacificispira spongiicola]
MKKRLSSSYGSLPALALAVLLASLGISIATVALPTLATAFSVPTSQVQWVILAYLLAVTVTIVTAGRLGDLLGHRRVFLAGLVLFSAASAACAVTPTFTGLIAARAVQGIGAAILMALPLSIVRDTVPTERTGAAMGLMGTMSAIGTALGPSLGGLTIAGAGWRPMFVALAAGGIVAAIVTLRGVPGKAAEPSENRPQIDIFGMMVLTLTLAAFTVSVTGSRTGFSTDSLLLLLTAGIGGIIFVWVERTRKSPLVDFTVLQNRYIAAALVTNLLITAVMMTTLVVGPFFLAYALGLNEATVGLVMAVGPLTAALSGIPAGRITDRIGAGRALVLGLAQTILGLICLSMAPRYLGTTGYILSLMLLTPGFQLFLAANNASVMVAAPDDKRGMIAGLLGLSRNLGFIIGASVMATVFAAATGSQNAAETPPDLIAGAFSTTFLTAVGLSVFALFLSIATRPSPAPRAEHSA